MWDGCRSPSFSSCIPSSSSDVICCSPLVHISYMEDTLSISNPIRGSASCASAISYPVCSGGPFPLVVFFAYFVIRSTLCTCHPLKSVDTSKNDSQSLKLEGTKYTWSPTS